MEMKTVETLNATKNDHQIIVLNLKKFPDKTMTSSEDAEKVLDYFEVQTSKLDREKLIVQEIDCESQTFYEKEDNDTVPIYMLVTNDQDVPTEQTLNKSFQKKDINSSLRAENMHVTLMEGNTMTEDCIEESAPGECSEYLPVYITNNDLNEVTIGSCSNVNLSSWVNETDEDTDVLFIPYSKFTSTLNFQKNDQKSWKIIPSERNVEPSGSENLNILNSSEEGEKVTMPQNLTMTQQDSIISSNHSSNVKLTSDSNYSKMPEDQEDESMVCDKLVPHKDDQNLVVDTSSEDDDDDDSFFFSNIQPKGSKMRKNFRNTKSRSLLIHSIHHNPSNKNINENEVSDSEEAHSEDSWHSKSSSLKKNEPQYHLSKKLKTDNMPDWDEFVRSPPVKKETKANTSASFDSNKIEENIKVLTPSLQRDHHIVKSLNFNEVSNQDDEFLVMRLQVPSPEPPYCSSFQCYHCHFTCQYFENFNYHINQCFLNPEFKQNEGKSNVHNACVFDGSAIEATEVSNKLSSKMEGDSKNVFDATESNDEFSAKNMKHLVAKIIEYIKEGNANDFVSGIYKGDIHSDRHDAYFSKDESIKKTVEDSTWFGPVTGTENTTSIYEHFEQFGKDTNSCQCFTYIYQVWIPEAIIKAISSIKNLSASEAKKFFLESTLQVPRGYQLSP